MPESTLKNPRTSGTLYRDKVPYCYATCEGCRGDTDNHALMPDECQSFISRPMDASVGGCPYYDDKRPYGKDLPELGFEDDGFPKVSSRFAEIVVRGVNDGTFAFWERDHHMDGYALPGEKARGEFRGLRIRHVKGSSRMYAGPWKEIGKGYYHLYEGTIDKAEMAGGVLILSGTDPSGHSNSRICIEIVDAPERKDAEGPHAVGSPKQRDLSSWPSENETVDEWEGSP